MALYRYQLGDKRQIRTLITTSLPSAKAAEALASLVVQRFTNQLSLAASQPQASFENILTPFHSSAKLGDCLSEMLIIVPTLAIPFLTFLEKIIVAQVHGVPLLPPGLALSHLCGQSTSSTGILTR